MAINFLENLFWCWQDKDTTKCMVGIASRERDDIFDFRNELTKSFLRDEELILQKKEGKSEEIDSLFLFFKEEDKGTILEIETSHDFSGIIIESKIHSPKQLFAEIEKVADNLNLNLRENKELENINIYSNVTFAG